MIARLVVTLVAMVLLTSTAPLCTEKQLGILLMHAKGGTSLPMSPIGRLARSLEANGFLVSAPDMPWSRTRGFDKTYEESMAEIDERVEALRKRGAASIVVGGHSIGANAALGYASRRDGLGGVLAIAPGHLPELRGFQKRTDNDWIRAKEMVKAGKGEVVATFKDANQGQIKEGAMKAKVYLSWFDPRGPAVIPVNTANLKPGTPLLWIIGEHDPLIRQGEAYAFHSAPQHPKNAYIVVSGGHNVTPQKGEREIISWLRGL